MTGFGPMLAKEFREFTRTWRIWLIAGTFAFFALTGPFIARFTPEILSTVIGDGLSLEVPAPTYLDAGVQWSSDLSQILMFVVLGLTAASVAGEVSAGTLVMPLTKPLDRTGFVLAKLVSVLTVTAAALVAGTTIVSGLTHLLFDDVGLGPVWSVALTWSVLALLLIGVTLVASCAFSSTIAALGVGLGGYVVLGILGLWGPARAYSPAGLSDAIGSAAVGEAVPMIPVLTGLVMALAVIALALAVFRAREL